MIEQAAFISFWVAMALYLVSTVLHAYHFVSKRALFSWYATRTVAAGFIAHTVALGLHWAAIREAPLAGTFSSLSLAAWVLVLIYFGLERAVSARVFGAVLLPIALVAMAVAQVSLRAGAGADLGQDAREQLDSWRVAMHVALVMAANAGFAVGAVASAFYLFVDRQLRHYKSTTLAKRLPSITQAQSVARRAILVALPVYTAGIVLGIIRAIEFDLEFWWFDPRVMLSGVVWGLFATFLLLHYRRGASGRALAAIALVGLAAVIVLAVLARTLPAGFHIFGL